MRTVKPLMNQSFIAKLLVLCMVLTLLPVSAFAAEADVAWEKDADNSAYYAITTDTTIGAVTLGSDAAKDVYYIYAGAAAPTLTLKGTTLNCTLYVGTDGTDGTQEKMSLNVDNVKLNGALSIWPNVTIEKLTFDYSAPAVATMSLKPLASKTVVLHSEDGKAATVKGDITIPANVTLEVEGDLEIPAGVTLTVAGKLNVDKEAKVTIAPNAELTLEDSAVVTVDGSIVVEEGAKYDEGNATVNGEITDKNKTEPEPSETTYYTVKADEKPEGGSVKIAYTDEAGKNADETLVGNDTYKVAADTRVTVTLEPEDGYYVASASTYTIGDDTDKFVTENGKVGEKVELVIEKLSGNLTIHAEFAKPSSTPVIPSGGNMSPTVLTKTAEHGTFTVSNRFASAGQTVTVTPKADEGYKVDEVVVTDKNGAAVEVKDNGDGTYSFVMPERSAQPVTVSVAFVCDGGDNCVTKAYTDVDQNEWYHKYVDYVVGKGLMLGTGENTFAPKATTTRAMVVTILWRLDGKPEAESSAFTDVADGEWYTTAVAWANKNDIVNGYGDGTFKPTQAISRQEMAAIFYRYAEYKGYDLTATDDLSKFTDADEVTFAVKEMKWAVGSGLINGRTATTIVPEGESTRAEVAAVLTRFCENVVK